jgi:hypothetical protein
MVSEKERVSVSAVKKVKRIFKKRKSLRKVIDIQQAYTIKIGNTSFLGILYQESILKI